MESVEDDTHMQVDIMLTKEWTVYLYFNNCVRSDFIMLSEHEKTQMIIVSQDFMIRISQTLQ